MCLLFLYTVYQSCLISRAYAAKVHYLLICFLHAPALYMLCDMELFNKQEMLPHGRLSTLADALERQGLLRPEEDQQQLSRNEMLERRMQHLESVIEGHVGHIAALRESVQRVAGRVGVHCGLLGQCLLNKRLLLALSYARCLQLRDLRLRGFPL